MTILHSPGPWDIKSSLSGEFRLTRYITDPAGHVIAEVRRIDDDNHVELANAHLMAAAPEMLDALIDLVRSDSKHVRAAQQQAVAAIAKAKGDTP